MTRSRITGFASRQGSGMSYQTLPPTDAQVCSKRNGRSRVLLLLPSTIVFMYLLVCGRQLPGHIFPKWSSLLEDWHPFPSDDTMLDIQGVDLCPQTGELIPSKNYKLWSELGDTYSTDEFISEAIDWLAGAVQIPTESYDVMDPIGVDPRWDVFGLLHDYLFQAFPLVHAQLNLTKVNTYGLLYEWEGMDTSLKPLLLTAHQDVVPVDPSTIDQWQYPPYSGYFDGVKIWGRGTSDDKNGLIGILSSVEMLLDSGFQPTRKIVLAFGFDEEATAKFGARTLGQYMEKTFGENAFAMIVDEGGGIANQFGAAFAIPSVSEKGYLDVKVEVSTPGGHSSVPPLHTSIGILSALIVEYESHPFPSDLNRTSPVYTMLKCLATHGPDMPKKLREAVIKSVHSDKALREVQQILAQDAYLKILLSIAGTTQAIDIVQGGVKANALPEQAWAIINHRISTESTVDEVKSRDTNLVLKLASLHNLSVTAFGDKVFAPETSSYGSLTLADAFDTALESAPVTPTGPNAVPYKLLSGTIKTTYNAHRKFNSMEGVTVVPGVLGGNTDTFNYWKLSEHIFRYNHDQSEESSNIHTVDESIVVDSFIEMIRFFTTLILNADESSEL